MTDTLVATNRLANPSIRLVANREKCGMECNIIKFNAGVTDICSALADTIAPGTFPITFGSEHTMSVNSINLPPSTLSNVVSALSPGGQTTNSDAANLSLSQLQRMLRQQLEQAFKKGSSLSDTGTALANSVSTTLDQYGVSEDQRNAVIDQLNQIFTRAGSRSEARQDAQQLLDNFVQSLKGPADEQSSASSPDAGQNLDVMA